MAQEFKEEFIDQISLANPSTSINDENMNLPLQELQHNIRFLMNMMSASSASSGPNFLSLIYGNLLDYDASGKKIFFNGGSFDCFEKKHSWIAIDDGSVVNDTSIQIDGAEKLLVYKGRASYQDSQGEHGIYLQREFFIPQQLRGSELVFAIKGTGVFLADTSSWVEYDSEIPFCDVSDVPNVKIVGLPDCVSAGTTGTTGVGTSGTSGVGTSGTSGVGTSGTSGTIPGVDCPPDLSTGCHARYEDIGIEVIGAQSVTKIVKVIGPWPHHDLYAKHDDWLPKFRTAYVSFRVGQNTSSIKIRIRRTRNDGAIAISQMFLGGLPKPFQEYEYSNFDINELFNFSQGVVKWNVTDVSGHHVAYRNGLIKLPNLLTKEQWSHLSQFNRNIEEFDWDSETGPRPNEVEFTTGPEGIRPQTHGLEFDPGFTRFCYFDMRIDGPDPGLSYLGISYFVNENDFSEELNCSGNCGKIKFDVWVAVVNPGDFGNPSDIQYEKFGYVVDVPENAKSGELCYFEVYGNFYNKLKENRGAVAYFVLSRDGESESDTLNGNFILVGCKTGIAVPPDDIPTPNTYNSLFVGDNNDC